MWELSVSRLKFGRFPKLFLVKNGIFHPKFYFFTFLAKLILLNPQIEILNAKVNFKVPKKLRGFFFSNQNVFKNLENAKNAILQILTLVLFYRLIVATHIGLVFLMVML